MQTEGLVVAPEVLHRAPQACAGALLLNFEGRHEPASGHFLLNFAGRPRPAPVPFGYFFRVVLNLRRNIFLIRRLSVYISQKKRSDSDVWKSGPILSTGNELHSNVQILMYGKAVRF